MYVEVDYNEDYGKVIINPLDEPEKWKLATLDEEVLKQTPFSDWNEAKEKWGPMWKEIRKSMKASYALENKERVVSTKDLHKPSPKVKELMEKSKKNREKVFVLKREKNGNIYSINGRCIAFYSSKFRKVNGGEKPAELLTNFWSDISWYGIANEGNVTFKNSKKPEKLLRRIIELGSEENDWVLDSFAGSGTTGAVAHKMGRKWIMIEMANHAETHCLPRLNAVIEGKDQDSHVYGGGFCYRELGKSLFKSENGIIGINYDNGDLVEAVCKIEGFKFIGREFLDKMKFHGVVNHNRYCHVTEEFVTQDLVDELSAMLSGNESLAIYCLKKTSRLGLPHTIQVKKIPRDIIKKFKLGA